MVCQMYIKHLIYQKCTPLTNTSDCTSRKTSMETQSVYCGSSATKDIFNSVGDLFATKKDVCDVVDDITDLVQHLTNPIQ